MKKLILNCILLIYLTPKWYKFLHNIFPAIPNVNIKKIDVLPKQGKSFWSNA